MACASLCKETTRNRFPLLPVAPFGLFTLKTNSFPIQADFGSWGEREKLGAPLTVGRQEGGSRTIGCRVWLSHSTPDGLVVSQWFDGGNQGAILRRRRQSKPTSVPFGVDLLRIASAPPLAAPKEGKGHPRTFFQFFGPLWMSSLPCCSPHPTPRLGKVNFSLMCNATSFLMQTVFSQKATFFLTKSCLSFQKSTSPFQVSLFGRNWKESLTDGNF